jgi:hypothetical protein
MMHTAILETVMKIILFGIGGLIGIFIVLLLVDDMFRPRISEEEFLECVGTEWKTGREIAAALNAKYCPKSKFFGKFEGIIYVRLSKLEEEGFIEHREKAESKEALKITGGIPRFEYRRTGLRRRIENRVMRLHPLTT